MPDDRDEPPPAPEDAGDAAGAGEEADRLPESVAGGSPRRLRDTVPQPSLAEAAPQPWLGRAGVPRPVEDEEWEAEPEWEGDDERRHHIWWMPNLAAAVAVLLFVVLSYGIWLISQAEGPDSGPNVPAPTIPSPPSPTAAPSVIASATSEPTPSTTATTIVVPRLVGLPEATAREVLDGLGLSYQLMFRPAPEPPDTVIETDPPAGIPVDPDLTITLVIADELTVIPPTVAPTTFGPTSTPLPSGSPSQPAGG